MRLHDKVTIIDKSGTLVAKDVPAYVGSATSKTYADDFMPVASLDHVRMIVGPGVVLSVGTHDVVWNSQRFKLDAPPLPRMRRGKVHHYTVALSHIAAV